MHHRIAAGVIVEHEGRILLVHHYKEGHYDFWVAPGGGAEGSEDLHATARREVLEECGLEIAPLQIAYIEEFTKPGTRECKVWFTARLIGGTFDCSAGEALREHIVEAAWLSPEEFDGKIVFPPMLHEQYWQDKQQGFTAPRYVGLRVMNVY